MPIITVQQGPRDVELKRTLVRNLTDAMVDSYGIPAESVQVWIHETPPDSWGAAGKLTADWRYLSRRGSRRVSTADPSGPRSTK